MLSEYLSMEFDNLHIIFQKEKLLGIDLAANHHSLICALFFLRLTRVTLCLFLRGFFFSPGPSFRLATPHHATLRHAMPHAWCTFGTKSTTNVAFYGADSLSYARVRSLSAGLVW